MCKTIKQKVSFQASPLEIYSLLTKPRALRAFTGQTASMSQIAGGRFANYAGRIDGINVELRPGRRIVQAWRERSFPEGVFSMATFNLVPTERGGTELTLTHRGVPKDLIPRISAEWKTLYWEKIRQFLKIR